MLVDKVFEFSDPKTSSLDRETLDESLSTFEYLDYDLIRENPKILCGFSDTTSILNEITEKTGLITYLGPSMKSICSGETDYRLKSVVDRFINGKTTLGNAILT